MDQMAVVGIPAARRYYSMRAVTTACADRVAKP